MLLGNLCWRAAADVEGAEARLALQREGARWYCIAAQVDVPGISADAPGVPGPAAPAAVVVVAPQSDAGAASESAHSLSELTSKLLQGAGASDAGPQSTGPHPDALFNLASAYLEGIPGVLPQDPAR